MSFLEANLERMRGIRETTGRMADRAFQKKEGRKQRTFNALQSGMQGYLEQIGREDKQTHEKEMQQGQQQWASEESKKQALADIGFIDGENKYVGSWTSPLTNTTYTWGNKQDYDLIKGLALQEAANLRGGDEEAKTWWEPYKAVTEDLQYNLSEVWNPDTGEFIGWGALGKEGLIDKFQQGIKGHGLTTGQQQEALNYFMTYLSDIEQGKVGPDSVAGMGAGPDFRTRYSTGPREGHIEEITPLGGGYPGQPEEPIPTSPSRLAATAEVSPVVENFYNNISRFQDIEPEKTFLQSDKSFESAMDMWNTVKSQLSGLTAEDISLLGPDDERKLGQLINSGTDDSKLTMGELTTFIDLIKKINSKKREQGTMLNPSGNRPGF